MRLERNDNETGIGKYGVINFRRARHMDDSAKRAMSQALRVLENIGVIDYGRVGSLDEFFVIKLKDKHAAPALEAYALSAFDDDVEFANDVNMLALRAKMHPNKKAPD